MSSVDAETRVFRNDSGSFACLARLRDSADLAEWTDSDGNSPTRRLNLFSIALSCLDVLASFLLARSTGCTAQRACRRIFLQLTYTSSALRPVAYKGDMSHRTGVGRPQGYVG